MADEGKKIVRMEKARAEKVAAFNRRDLRRGDPREPLEARAVAAAACGAPEHQQKLRQQLGARTGTPGHEHHPAAVRGAGHPHRGVFRRTGRN